jgi:hypothetical protein
MTCPVCNRLRAEWYATATPCDSKNLAIIVKVRDGDRLRADYREALERYRQHRKECAHAG